MKLQTIVKETRIISATHCTPDEMAKLLKDLGAPDLYNGTIEIYQEVNYDYDGYPTPTGLYTVDLTQTSSHDDKPDEVITEFDPQLLAAFGINKND